MSASLGWIFCEIAFRLWDWLPDDADARWWFGVVNAPISAFYRLGCWFYGKVA